MQADYEHNSVIGPWMLLWLYMSNTRRAKPVWLHYAYWTPDPHRISEMCFSAFPEHLPPFLPPSPSPHVKVIYKVLSTYLSVSSGRFLAVS